MPVTDHLHVLHVISLLVVINRGPRVGRIRPAINGRSRPILVSSHVTTHHHYQEFWVFSDNLWFRAGTQINDIRLGVLVAVHDTCALH